MGEALVFVVVDLLGFEAGPVLFGHPILGKFLGSDPRRGERKRAGQQGAKLVGGSFVAGKLDGDARKRFCIRAQRLGVGERPGADLIGKAFALHCVQP